MRFCFILIAVKTVIISKSKQRFTKLRKTKTIVIVHIQCKVIKNITNGIFFWKQFSKKSSPRAESNRVAGKNCSNKLSQRTKARGEEPVKNKTIKNLEISTATKLFTIECHTGDGDRCFSFSITMTFPETVFHFFYSVWFVDSCLSKNDSLRIISIKPYSWKDESKSVIVVAYPRYFKFFSGLYFEFKIKSLSPESNKFIGNDI